MIRRHHKLRRGFSLLEILLVLGLTMIIVTIIFSAIYQYMLVLTQQQDAIERKQIARGVTRMISDDLSGAIQYKAEDYSALENLVASQSLAGFGAFANVGGGEIDGDSLEQDILDEVTGGGDSSSQTTGTTGATAGPGAGADPGATGAAQESPGGSEDEEVEEVEELGRPTLIGTQNLLRVDTSRLPRLDEYNPLVARREIDQQLPSDIKTVTYFFSDSEPTVKDEIMPELGRNGGLYRRRIDRAVEAFLGEESISDSPDEFCELIAPEVAGIQFRYFDGSDWLDEWDSAEQMGFPSAIEVIVSIDSQRATSDRFVRSETQQEELEILRTVVYLPVAEIIPEEDEMQQDEGGNSDR